MLLFIKLDPTKIPKKKEAIKFTIEVFWMLKPVLISKLFCIYILKVNPIELPNKRIKKKKLLLQYSEKKILRIFSFLVKKIIDI